jgi:hypothetical protein
MTQEVNEKNGEVRMNGNFEAISWYENHKKMKEDSINKSQISLINNHLQRILHQVQIHIDKNKYQIQVEFINHLLNQSLIWDLKYISNLESKSIALEQGVLISLILHHEETIPNRLHLQHENQRLMRQLGNISWSLFNDFKVREQRINRTPKFVKINMKF